MSVFKKVYKAGKKQVGNVGKTARMAYRVGKKANPVTGYTKTTRAIRKGTSRARRGLR